MRGAKRVLARDCLMLRWPPAILFDALMRCLTLLPLLADVRYAAA
jgi:hypothetical protein